MTLKEQRAKVFEFIKRGENILIKERQIPEKGIIMPKFVAGPLFDAWMGEINIFNERYLKSHPLYNAIHTTYFHYKTKASSCENMLGHLRALSADEEFFEDNRTNNTQLSIPNFEEMLLNDIDRCNSFLQRDSDENEGRVLYSEITARYDPIIENFGYGLYSYFPEQHFYDLNISIKTIRSNLNTLVQKMISYVAFHYGKKLSNNSVKTKSFSNKVFIVHGHDDSAKNEMARTLEKIGLDVIILHEQPDAGRTIIEKIEDFTDVAFAVILYTECDIGRSKDESVKNIHFRARQNVVFEHGYLMGKLGRKNVCAFVKGKVETPSDISGVIYTDMDEAGAWKLKLGQNIKEAGLSVDLNKLT